MIPILFCVVDPLPLSRMDVENGGIGPTYFMSRHRAVSELGSRSVDRRFRWRLFGVAMADEIEKEIGTFRGKGRAADRTHNHEVG